MVGAVTHKCSPACSNSCRSSTLRTGRIEHSSSRRNWSGRHMPLLTSGGGLATEIDVSFPKRHMQEAQAKRPDFRGMSSVVGIWFVCRMACTSLGSAHKAATTSGTRRRSHVGLRWGGRNWLMEFEGDLLVMYLWGHRGVNGRGLLPGAVEVAEHDGPEAGSRNRGVPGAPRRDEGCGECVGVLRNVFWYGASLHKRQRKTFDNLHLRQHRGDRGGGRK